MKKLKIIIGIFISLILLYFVFRDVEPQKVLHELLNINYFIIIPAVIIQILSYWVRAMRWTLMLSSIKKISTSRIFPIICINYLANNLLPLRAGEFVRAYMIGQKEGISKATALSTVIVERVYDGVTLALFFGVIAFIYPFPTSVKISGALLSMVFVVALLFILVIALFREKALKVINFFLKFLPEKIRVKVYGILEKLIDGFDVIKDKKNLLMIAFYSVLAWCMEACLIYAIAAAFGFSSTFYLALITLVFVNFFIMIPSSPGNIGTFEGACRYSLGLFNVTKDVTASFALIYRVFQYIPITIIGFICLFKEGMTFSSITSLSKKDEAI